MELLKVTFENNLKEGDHVLLILKCNERFQGNVVAIENDSVTLQVIEAYWKKTAEGKFVADVAIDEQVVPWDEISRFQRMI
jgi:hypothetical protein